jgi:hypothetical protein
VRASANSHIWPKEGQLWGTGFVIMKHPQEETSGANKPN